MSKEGIKENFPTTLEECRGLINMACRKHNISKMTYYRWRAADSDFAAKCDEVIEYIGDIVESKLLTNIMEGKETSLIFYAKTKLKHRGYVERVEQTGADGAPLHETLTVEDDSMLQAYIERAIQERVHGYHECDNG